MPKGGGAIRGIGEKFAANPVTGTGSMSVPIATSPGRSGFGPQFSLTYDSGSGNGPFGFGWSLSLPSITRKTDKGLPRYFDTVDSDVFVFSGAEDLVPVYRQDPDGTWVALHQGFQRDADTFWVRDPTGHLVVHEDEFGGYRVRRYRPRIEGLFARIERWSKTDSPGDVHWRSISRDNVLTLYGRDGNSRLADPLNPNRIFSWLICESRDDKGNGIRYLYAQEDGTFQLRPGQVDPFVQAHQLNRGIVTDSRRTAQRYLQRVLYGNLSPLLDDHGRRPRYLSDLPNPPTDTSADWLFEVRFDYGELDEADPTGQPEKSWFYRPDAFSSYRSGFEVRTCRRCERVLMLHHIPGQPAREGRAAQPGYEGMVRSTEFTYDDELDPAAHTQPIYSFLTQVRHAGWKQEIGAPTRRTLPPVEFEYSRPVVQNTVEEVESQNLPIGLDGAVYRWIDLHGEGLPGILTEQSGAWYYERNQSPISPTTTERSGVVKATFARLETVALRPNVSLNSGAEFMDLAGDGHPDVMVMDGPTPGLYEHDEAEGWDVFRPFHARLNLNFHDPNLRMIDLDGDGHADVLITEDEAFVWYPSLGEDGFGPAQRVVHPLDEEKGPRIVFADGTQSVSLADLSGDGLTDIVRIRNGEVCYWPNLGYGRFGVKVTMDNAPWFDHPDQFDHKRVRLADIDGSGTTDIIYLHRSGVRLYFNQSGNSWSQPQALKVFPRVDDLVSIMPVDLLGNGTACLVWSSPLPNDTRRPLRYINLMGGQKPHLLIGTINNLGAETRVEYAPSTKFYLQDKRDGATWITRLPFPVHVVERVGTYDHISKNRFITRSVYHHGYFDGEEREFRGFGMVEQWDTEEIGTLSAVGGSPVVTNLEPASQILPVHTKTWFHTGVSLDSQRISHLYAHEYFGAPSSRHTDADPGMSAFEATLLPDTLIPKDLTPDEAREACRALKGLMLRQEVYADDAPLGPSTANARRTATPYTIAEQNFSASLLQSRAGNRHAVFLIHPRETLTAHLERKPDDPRFQHALTLEVDPYGNVLRQVAVGYGRLQPDPRLPTQTDQDTQTRTLLTYTESLYTNAIDDISASPDTYRTPLSCEASTYEVTGVIPENGAARFNFDEWTRNSFALLASAAPLDYASDPDLMSPQKRLIEQVRTLYRKDDLSALLPLRHLESLALPGESYKLAFTTDLLTRVYERGGQALLPDLTAILSGPGLDQGGYVFSDSMKAGGRFPISDLDDYWWVPSGRSFFSTNPVDNAAAEFAQAQQHFFLPRRSRNPFDQDAFVDFDAYDLLLMETSDALGNRVTVDANDYRVLQPFLISDPNRNQTEVAFDTLGLVVGTAVMGKPLSAKVTGDTLSGFVPDITLAQLEQFMSAPRQPSANPSASEPTQIVRDILQGATMCVVYDLDRFQRLGEPPFAATIARETHVTDLPQGQTSRLQLSFSYSDGFGREIQKKIQAEPGPLEDGGPVVNPRWVGSGWTIFNNKGMPVRQYEPFFSKRERPDGTLYGDHRFEFGVMVGVSPVLFYDPAGRVIATLNPNHTYAKVIFDPWKQTTYDVNDTCAPGPGSPDNPDGAQTGDPRTDPDIMGYVAGYFKTQPATWETWHDQRLGNDLGPDERNAALRAEAHADTPTTVHFDGLGRSFLTVTRNRVVCKDHPLDGNLDEEFSTRVELDIEGNQRAVFDERKLPDAVSLPLGALEQRTVMRYDHDMLGTRLHQISMEAGERWMLNDVAGKPIRTWDSRGHTFTTTYDALRRPVEQTVRGSTPESDPRTLDRDIQVDKIEYGEGLGNAEAINLRTRIYRHFDSAGVATNARLDGDGHPTEGYDFKGNLLHSTRRFIRDYRAIPDWSAPAELQLDAEFFEGSTRYDALNRPIQSIAPHSSIARAEHPDRINVLQPVFNEANLLERVDVWLERSVEPVSLLDPAGEATSPVGVTNIDYDAKGQRTLIDYKTQERTVIRTTYSYDNETFRLTQLYTRRGVDPDTAQGVSFVDDCENPNTPPPDLIAAPEKPPLGKACGLQNLHYTYDPAGNITHIRDDAQQTIYFKNKRVEPSNDYTYDALYRLIQASGREHLGQQGNGDPNPPTTPDGFNTFHTRLDHPGDGNAMGTYIERYVYDGVGNFLQMQHRGSDAAYPSWTRAYAYLEASLIEDGSGGMLKNSNRLSQTTLNSDGANPPQLQVNQHDAHGNMIRMPHLGGPSNMPNLHWNCKDQLRRTDLGGGGVAWYVYDASGQRVRKVWEKMPGLIEERIYLDGFEIFRQHGGVIAADTATLERETLHVMDDQHRIAVVEARTLDTAGNDQAPRRLVRNQFGNHLGSASLELDERAQVVSYEEYAPYGSSTYQAVRSQTETAKRYRYTGKERDEESGLYYHGARYYAPWLALWTQCDPKSVGGGINLYLYCGCNPITRFDGDGADWQFCNPFSDSACGVVSTAKAAYSSAPVQTAVGITEGLVDLRKAIAPTPWEMVGKAVDTAKDMKRAYQEYGGGSTGVLMAVNQANPLFKAAVKSYDAYNREGGGTQGILAAVNEHNPVYHTLVAAYETKEAVDRGDYRSAGKQSVNTVVGVVQTVAIAVGGAELATGVLEAGGLQGVTTDAVVENAAKPPLPPTKLLGEGSPKSTVSRQPGVPGQTVDPLTGHPVGRFIVDPKGNTMIEPAGGQTVGSKNGVWSETRYPNGSPYQQQHGSHGTTVSNPHGHGFQEGPGMNQRGPSLAPNGKVVPVDSKAAHWEIRQ